MASCTWEKGLLHEQEALKLETANNIEKALQQLHLALSAFQIAEKYEKNGGIKQALQRKIHSTQQKIASIVARASSSATNSLASSKASPKSVEFPKFQENLIKSQQNNQVQQHIPQNNQAQHISHEKEKWLIENRKPSDFNGADRHRYISMYVHECVNNERVLLKQLMHLYEYEIQRLNGVTYDLTSSEWTLLHKRKETLTERFLVIRSCLISTEMIDSSKFSSNSSLAFDSKEAKGPSENDKIAASIIKSQEEIPSKMGDSPSSLDELEALKRQLESDKNISDEVLEHIGKVSFDEDKDDLEMEDRDESWKINSDKLDTSQQREKNDLEEELQQIEEELIKEGKHY